MERMLVVMTEHLSARQRAEAKVLKKAGQKVRRWGRRTAAEKAVMKVDWKGC